MSASASPADDGDAGAASDDATKYQAQVDTLVRTVEAHGLELSVRGQEPPEPWSWWRVIRMKDDNDLDVSIWVDDEYADAPAGSQPMLLHLVLAMCECYEEADDFLAWATDAGLDASDSWALEVYREMGEVVPKIRERVGGVRAIPHWDFHVGAGATSRLRAL